MLTYRMAVEPEKQNLKVDSQDVIRNYNSKLSPKTKSVSQFAFAKHFQSHMVLQQAPQRANLYGFAAPRGQVVDMKVTVIPIMKIYYYKTTVRQGPVTGLGVWNFLLDPFPGNTTVAIRVVSEEGSLSLNDVIFGDVWICSGQSNMQFTVIQIDDAEEELADAINYPNIRLMTVNLNESPTPLYDFIKIEQDWTAPNRSSIGGPPDTYFSAMCWLFGKAIHKARGYPIGLVDTDYTGTPAEAWSSPEALAACGNEKKKNSVSNRSINELPNEGFENPNDNSAMWNAMIHPLLNMTIYGVIWYQGESDASGSRMNKYNCTFPAMIKDWRLKFNAASNGQTKADFPFGFVQLAPYRPDQSINVGYCDIRWHQTADTGYVPNDVLPNVFMSVAMDLADFTSPYGAGHPRKKRDVATRLVLGGLAVAYGQQLEFQGPLPASGFIVPLGLNISYGDRWSLDVRSWDGFDILCGIRWLPTQIIDYNDVSVILYLGVCSDGEKFNGLRYAWRESPCAYKKCAIYDSASGLPAPTFTFTPRHHGNETYFTFGGPTYI
ncbi:sialate O-acetylesterase [Biomphalaria pfeifferi]|uniref:Sialate O-acetylesterase n=1 Tax=Biomphalaria pfeifferi TaxID=112525 RepID=A0AAD8EYI4_BIOPF|nr:sialate O-acetylesterase [Biomphalaria pfeifferi]